MAVTNPQAANEAVAALQTERTTDAETLDTLESTRYSLETGGGPAAPTDMQGFAMTEERRAGTMALDVEGHGSVRFGKPSGRASTQILAPIEEMERGESELSELTAFIWGTLAAWSLDTERDADHWADEHGLMDALDTIRNLALGGNAPRR